MVSASVLPLAAFAPHGQCYLWSSPLITTHVLTDCAIAIAYFSIPISLVVLWQKRGDLPYHWLFALFATFILACGASHAVEVWNIWHADYWLSASIKIVTASSSILTAILLINYLPRLIAAPGPRVWALAQADLERLVAERAAALQKAVDQLKKEESNHRFLAETMPQIIWTANKAGKLDFYSHRWQLYTGLKTTEGCGWQEVIHADDFTACAEAWTQAVAAGHPFEVECRLKRGLDGLYLWHLGRAFPQRDENGEIVRWVGTWTDIHQQKQAEQNLEERVRERTAALATSEERFRQAFEFAGIGMAIVGLDGAWVRVNQAVCDIVGYNESELLAKTFQDITHPDDLNADLAYVRELLEGKRRRYQLEKRYYHRDGHVVWIRLTASLIHDSAGNPVHFVSQIEDITDRKQLVKSLADARDQAIEASRAKSNFLATMSHEIRTPMNGIIGMTDLLLETPLSPEQQEMGAVIRRSGESLLTIINDILDFSKIEAGKLRLQAEPFAFYDLLEETAALLAPQARSKKIELVCDLDPRLAVKLSGDSGRIQQIVTNLLGNAVKFTHAGEVVLEARLLRASDKEINFRVEVRDTGIGMSPDVKRHLFLPFVQGEASFTRRFGGTGLGLAICRQLVGLMGGEIGVESVAGKGSTFWFELSLEKVGGADSSAPSSSIAGRVLIVDDNETNRRIYLGQFESLGIRADAVSSGTEALQALIDAVTSSVPYDLVLLDWHMPEMDGFDLASRIRSEPVLSSINIVIMSSSVPDLNDERLKRLNFASTLTKPVRLAQLSRVMSKLLGKKPPAAPSSSQISVPPAPRALRLLLAEDNYSNQLVARLMLEQMGHSVDVVENGIQALRSLSTKSFDAVLMDCQMPELDGYEATRRVRSGRLPGVDSRVPIIALTAFVMQGDRDNCIAAGMDDYASKPLNREEVMECFHRCGLFAMAAESDHR